MSLSLEDYRAARKARAAADSDSVVVVLLSTGWATVDEDGIIRASLTGHFLGDLDADQ